MSPDSLLNKLETLDKVEVKILDKLRRQVDDPAKDITVKKILTFLVKNEYLTKDEAVEIRKELKYETKVKMAGGRKTEDLVAGIGDTAIPVEAEDDELNGGSDEVAISPVDNPVNEMLDDKTLVLDPLLEELPSQFDALAQQGGGGWDSVVPENTAPSRFGFDGKLDSGDQWSTKWVFIGFGILGMLLIAGVLLSFVLSFITAVDRFEAAMQSFENGTYPDAVKKFDEFLDKHSSHEKAPIARLTRVQALLADTFKQENWDETIVRAETHLPSLIEDENVELETIRQDLAVILPNTTLAIAKRATKQESKSALIEQLAKAKKAKQLVDNPIYIPNSRKKQASVADTLEKIEEEIAKAEILIKKQDDFDVALAEIISFREQGQTDKAFAVYNKLIRAYGDLRANEQLRQEIRAVSQMESQLVKAVEPNDAQSTGFRSSPIQSSVILSSQTGTPIPSLTGEIVPVLADGSVYGMDLGDGAVRWRHFVGYQTDIQPFLTDNDNVLIADQHVHDLLVVESGTGNLIWRIEIGEPFLEPQIDGDNIYLTSESGLLRRISLADGAVKASVKIPQNANVPMVRFGRQNVLIQPGSYSNLYVLSDDNLECQNVIYTGHRPGSVFAKPVVWNSFVLLCVNTSGACDLYVLGPEPETEKIDLVQRIVPITRGIVAGAPSRFGRFMLINSEDGDLKILEADSANDTSPIRVLDSEKFENQEKTRTYVTTAGSQMWIASSGIMRYKVSRSLGAFDRQVVSDSDDTFVGPLRKVGDTIVHVRKRSESSLTSVSAVDSKTLKQIWRTDIGGPLAGPPILFDDQIAAISSQGDLFKFDQNVNNDLVATQQVKSSKIIQNLLFDQTIPLGNQTAVCIGPPSRSDMIYIDASNGTSKLVRLPAPADKSACRPVRIGSNLIFPTRQGQVVRINPTNGRIVGAPFLPTVRPGDDVQWKRPAVLENDRFVIGANGSLYLVDAANQEVLRNVAQLDIKEVLKSETINLDNRVFAVVEATNLQKLMSVDVGQESLSAGPSIELPSKLSSGPWRTGSQILMLMENGNLVSFDKELNQTWSVAVPVDALADAPLEEGSSIKLFYRNGKLLTLSADSGEIESTFELGQPIVHSPTIANGKTIFAGSDGSVHLVNTQ